MESDSESSESDSGMFTQEISEFTRANLAKYPDLEEDDRDEGEWVDETEWSEHPHDYDFSDSELDFSS